MVKRKNDQLVPVYKTSAPPFPLAIMASAYILPMRNSFGINDQCGLIYEVIINKHHEWYFSESEIRRISPKIITALIKQPRLIAQCKRKYLQNIQKLIDLLDRNTIQKKLEFMSDREIGALFKEAARLYREASYYVEPAGFSLELYGQNFVKQKLKIFFENHGISLKQSEFDNYFATIVNFTEMSFVQRAELSLLNIALFRGLKRKLAITEHERNFYWQFYDYYGPILNQFQIKEELSSFTRLSKKEILRRIKEIKVNVKENQNKQKQEEKRYPLSTDLKTAFGVIRNFAYFYSDIKKEMTSRANVGFGELIKFISRKFNLDEFLLHYATFEELLGLFDGKKIDLGTLKNRTVKSVLVCQKPTVYYEFLAKKERERLLRLTAKKLDEMVTLFKGIPACSGKYTGTVKIVKSPSQISKIRKGDILVTHMTTVSYVQAMKKVGAIITDLGGITSHAAIISRELNVPCIIGTKIATAVLRDDDVIEVNANHGIIRIVQKI